jgi:hypothetical protein
LFVPTKEKFVLFAFSFWERIFLCDSEIWVY